MIIESSIGFNVGMFTKSTAPVLTSQWKPVSVDLQTVHNHKQCKGILKSKRNSSFKLFFYYT